MSFSSGDSPTRPIKAETSNLPIRLNSTDLFQGQSRLVIMHKGSEYQLKITRYGKLILTK
ncbi:hemin uptake protein HemP [Candidatus Thiodiazotropha sp. CDECU1]|uniref:hemin uptake protein HemP n=1 Tax=Candidatus Thiodiazotropha sp. CDECU1 TaxID=3065865 RepID=UPI002930F2AE|nr:hemin uptake protein HemP [Candidatus Thiodiazotropha sp. CDECU1]